ncbi:Abc transporter [Globisporangium polare]
MRNDATASQSHWSMSSYGTFFSGVHGDGSLPFATASTASAAHAVCASSGASVPLIQRDAQPQHQHSHPPPKSCSPDRDPSVSFLSRLLFLFVRPLATRSRAQRLHLDDIWPLADENKNAHASRAFRAEYARTKRLWTTILHTERRAISTGAAFAFLSVVCVSAVPLLLYQLLLLVIFCDARGNMLETLLLLGGIHCGVVLGEICSRHYHFHLFNAQVRAVTSIRSLVFEKSIDKSHRNGRRKGRSIAAIATIYSTNLIYVSWMITRMHNTWVAASKLFVLLLMLNLTLHVSAVVIITSLAAVCMIMLLLTLVVARASEKFTKKRAKTLNAVHECFKGIQAVKLHAWERKMHDKIMRARGKEERRHWRTLLVRTLRFCFIWESPALASVAIFYFLATHDQFFSPATVFTALVLFDRIQIEIYALIYAVRVGVDGLAALRRIQKYLRHCDTFVKSPVIRVDIANQYISSNVVVAVDHAFFTEAMGSSDFVLANVSIRAKTGELVVVYGKAGAGKSTLLASLLGEVMRVRGHVFVSAACKIAYCSEEPWLQTLSVRDNILFGSDYSEVKYHRVLDACCLIDDLNALPEGEDTMVGPKGINLSGGQNARVALARALYSDADLLVLDCPLAGADAIVQSTVFRKCFLELLRHKTIILATHNPEIISSDFVDRLWHVDAMSVTEVDRNERQCRSETGSRRIRRLADVPPWRAATSASSSSLQVDNGSKGIQCPWEYLSGGGDGAQLQASKGTLRRSQAQHQTQDLVAQVERSPFSLEIPGELLWSREVGWKMPATWLALFLVYGALDMAKNFWLMHWSTLSTAPLNAMRHAATVYGALICGAFAVILSALLVLFSAIFIRSQKFFQAMTASLLGAPMGFFYKTPIGEILLRYASDMQASDLFVSFHIAHLARSALSLVAAVSTIGYLLGPLAGALFAVATLYVCREIVADRLIAQIFTVRDKLDAFNLNFVSEALDGSAVIRAFGDPHVQRFRLQHGQMLDKRSRIAFAVEVFNDWALIRYSLLVGVFLVLVALVLASGALTSTSALGLVLHCVFSIQHDLVAFSGGLLSATVHFTSIKNIVDLQSIEPEEQQQVDGGEAGQLTTIDASIMWPAKGAVVFDRVWFQYDRQSSDPTKPPFFALRDVSFAVAGGEKVGVIGRTGSGKSSLAMALFRVHETTRGRILVDGVDICRLRLSDLRSRLCIIPQTPLFYRCSVRRYLDPFGEFDDTQLWRALATTGLTDTGAGAAHGEGPEPQLSENLLVKSLEKQLGENGENWSLGERQMLVLARALLKPSRLLILDEAFSSVDQASDTRLLGVVEREFADATVFLITHRLDEVLLGCDRIIVMRDSRVAEVGSAQELVADPDSAFYEFLETTLLTF